MQRLRKFFFYLFTAAYLVSCPLVILYALGYAFKPIPEPQLIETGLIHLVTAPPGASVYLEGRRYRQTTPTALRELLPGEYALRLVLDGYQPWKRKIRVEARQTALLEKILLIPKEPQEEELSSEEWQRCVPIPETRYLLLMKARNLKGAAVYDEKTGALRPLFPTEEPSWEESDLLSYWTVPGSPWILLWVRQKGGSRWIWLSLDEEEPRPKDLTELFPQAPQEVTWWPRRPNRLFVFRQGKMDLLELGENVLYPQRAQGIRGVGMTQPDELALLTKEGTLQRVRYDGEILETFLRDSPIGHQLFGERSRFSIHRLPGEVWIFLGSRGELLTNRLPYRLVERGVRGFQYDERRRRLLVWTHRKLGIVEFSLKAGEGPFEAGPVVQWVYERAARIQQAFWVHEGSHLLFRDGKSVCLLEVETRSHPALDWSVSNALRRLVDVAEASTAFYSEEEGKLLYLSPRQRRLTSRSIVPKLLEEP